MWLIAIAFLGGVLTVLSPCILPVIPFVFAKADQPFRRSGLPLLLGMALTFAGFSTLALLGGAWVAQLNEYGRWIALVLLTVFGLSLIFPEYLEHLMTPLTNWGSKLSSGGNKNHSVLRSVVLGVATGLLWAPCAGPILGLILTGAATQGNPGYALILLLSYALGSACILGLALIGGGKFFSGMKKYLKAEKIVKRTLGVAVLLGVVAIAFNWDRTVLTRISKLQTESLEMKLISESKTSSEMPGANSSSTSLGDEGVMPNIDGLATTWLNSRPLSMADLKGHVVLIDFWTYSCINCLRTLPYVKAWNEKYKDQGLIIIGVHAPEFAFEKSLDNVKQAISELGITYPVALDNDLNIWHAFENQYWPAHYFIDREGHIRHHHFGEGGYEESEAILKELLGDNGKDLAKINAQGAMAAPMNNQILSPETYIGNDRAENFKATRKNLKLNEWTLEGDWHIGDEMASLTKAPGKIVYHFHARDLHLVLGPGAAANGVRFKVLLDGKIPGANHGVDTDENGVGIVKEHRLYQLIRQSGESMTEDHIFEIEFLDPGVEAFAFTFG
jgi:cytochrome c biogenesis protein CcdA/thiol-disulfide isomerase/thioredoxin